MERRYQVFISSTFRDLKDERKAVLRAILELNNIPAGMEFFPATDDSAWQLIKDIIDDSDYYILIIGGRYGSLDEAGISYTEKEYKYALETNKPVLAFLHKNPDTLPRERTETNEKAWNMLKTFKEGVEEKHTCKYWDSPEGLRAEVITSLTSETKRSPGTGWIRASEVPSDSTLADILELRKNIVELEKENNELKSGPPAGTEELMHGDDTLDVECTIRAEEEDDIYGETRVDIDFKISPTWDEIFANVAPALLGEISSQNLNVSLEKFFRREAVMHIRKVKEERYPELEGKKVSRFFVDESYCDTCLVQLRALGLITSSERNRSVKDTASYWTLTKYGEQLMVKLRAIHRPKSPWS